MWLSALLILNFGCLNILKRFLGSDDGTDWYRSISCLIMSIRGLYGVWCGEVESMREFSCTLFISYIATDIYNMHVTKNWRLELWGHHIMSILGALSFYFDQQIAVSFFHKALVCELLSICNALLRKKPKLLKQWRTFALCCIRFPLVLIAIKYAWYNTFTYVITAIITKMTITMVFLFDCLVLYKMYFKKD